jgi:predicted DsbA family dithiol-disulfide isomerase
MADNKKKEEKKTEFAGEKKLGELLEKFDKEFRKEMEGRPYLLTVTSGYMIGQENDKATLAAQWSWRSNVIIGGEDSERMVEFLTGQLKEVAEHPEYGVKKKYKK